MYVYPSNSRANNIQGRLQLYTQGPKTYLLWEPVHIDTSRLSPSAKGMYASTSASFFKKMKKIYAGGQGWAAQTAPLYRLEHDLGEVFSIRRYVPRLGYSNIVLQLHGGVTLAPLHFHGGYGDFTLFFETLGLAVELVKYVATAVQDFFVRGEMSNYLFIV